MAQHTSYRTVKVDGLSIFYREAGPKDAPRFCCFMDFRRRRACSSRCSRGLRTSYHMVAPDYPGFGHSDWPEPKEFCVHLRQHRQGDGHSLRRSDLSQYTLYMQDYGGPVGFRMALRIRSACRP